MTWEDDIKAAQLPPEMLIAWRVRTNLAVPSNDYKQGWLDGITHSDDRIQQMMAALREYGSHHWTCETTHDTGLACDCEYGRLIKGES